jgi:nitronate monooxygenase
MAKRNSAWNRTRVSNKLGIEYPIIQGPLGGFSSQRLTAAVSNFGGLGSFGAHGLAPSAIQEVVAEIRSLTNKPFAMNLWVSMEDEGAATSDAEAFERALSYLAPHLEAKYRRHLPDTGSPPDEASEQSLHPPPQFFSLRLLTPC